ncbi:MAG: sensor domain-containing diguanylate cyclase [Eubacterium sp.]
MQTKNNKFLLIIVFIITICFSGAVIFIKEVGDYKRLQDRATYVTESQVSKLQYVLNTLFLKTQTLETLVVESGGNIENFDYIAETLLDNTAIRSVQLAPKGVVSMIYPLKGNEDGFGDLFSDPDRATEAIAARDSGEMTLSGPFKLYQGGLGVVARRPIYLQNAQSEKTFWGFSIIVLNLPDAFYPAELNKLVHQGYAYKLHRIHPDTGDVQIIDESSDVALSKPVEVSFDVPNATWTFSVAPANGWVNELRIFGEILLGLLFTLLITLLAKNYSILRDQKSEMQNLSLTDSLTELNNRRMLSKALDALIQSSVPFVLYFLDFNGFKQVNDLHGHHCGDLFLMACAKRLTDFCGSDHFAFRNGGDEFSVIVTKNITPETCDHIKEALQHLFDPPIVAGDITIETSISVGYCTYPADAQTTDQILHIADQNMYIMKKEFYTQAK